MALQYMRSLPTRIILILRDRIVAERRLAIALVGSRESRPRRIVRYVHRRRRWKRLSHAEALVMTMLFGLDGRPARTFSEIGSELGVSREQARLIRDAAARKLADRRTRCSRAT